MRAKACEVRCISLLTDSFVPLSDLQGGFSYVYRGEIDGDEVAVKKIVTMDEEQVLDVDSEVAAHRKFENPHLLQLIGFGERITSGTREFFLVFPLCEGSLRNEIDATTLGEMGVMDRSRMLKVFRELLLGLDAMHSCNPPLAHRDVKPENILFLNGRTVLMDFGSLGVARRTAETRRLAMAIQEEAAEQCTMPYRAPELWDVQTGAAVDEKVDVWSAGCVLYAMCYGYSPAECEFAQNSALPRIVDTSYLKVLAKVVYPPSSEVNEPLRAIMEACLQQEPRQRPSVKELLDMVDAARAKG